MFLASNDGITQQSGIINECFLILQGNGSGNATLNGANAIGALAVTNPFNANESAFANLSFTNAVNMFLADIIVDEFTLTAPEFDLEPDFTSITKNGSGESNFNANMDINSGTIPARVIFNHNAGTINFNGTINDFDGLLDYNGTNAITTNFSGTTTVNPDITPNFGSLNSTGTFIAKRGVIGILNEARFSGSSAVLKGEAFLSSGPTIVENGATITPGNINDVSLLLFSDLTISSATYAPVIEGNDEYDALEVLGDGTVTLNNATLAPIGGYPIQPGDEIVIIDNNGPSAVSGIFNNLPENAGVVFGDFAGMITYVGGDEGKDVVLVPDTIDPVAVCQDITLAVGVDGITVLGSQVDGGSTDNGVINEFLINGQASINFTLIDLGENDVTLTVIDAAGNTAQCDATITLVSNVNATLPILISEYQPITSFSDPQTIEIKGEPGESFIGSFVIIDGDNSRNGRGVVSDVSNISGVFNADGLLTATVPNLTNPSHTAVLTSSFSGTVDATDIDTDNDGVADDLSAFGTIFDAVGVSDGGACCPIDVLYATDFGGINLPDISNSPSLIFREGSVGDFYQISASNDNIYDATGTVVDPLFFNLFPTDNGTFGDINPAVTITSTDVFITTWKTDNPGDTSDNRTIEIPTTGGGYDYSVDWGDGTIETGFTANATHTYDAIGTYTVRITGDFPRIFFNFEGDRLKIQEVQQWGTIEWNSFSSAFVGCENLQVTATDAPNLSNVTDLSGMFAICSQLTGHTSFNNWDVSNIEIMEFMFLDAINFNQPLDQWNVGNVTTMEQMFIGATNFDQDLGSWDVSSLATASAMFNNVTLSTNNYDNILIGWATLDTGEIRIPSNISFSGGNSQFCLASDERQELIDTYGWSIADGGLDTNCPTDILLSPKVYLQGASINPIVGEENLMRDDLRSDGLFPLSSPYSDGVSIDASVLTVTGSDAIVDWVMVELRDQTDNTIVIDSQSALVQRDGDVTAIDGVSPLAFAQVADRYYVVVNHRNHVGVITATTQALTTATSLVDFTSDPTFSEGGTNSVILLPNGNYAMYSGDFDSNTQVQNTDANAVVQLIGGAGYELADMDLNTQIQNADVNALINPNIGLGEQFSRPAITADMLSTDVTLAFANAQITNDGMDDYYEADIIISGTTDFYIGSGQVYLDYSTTAFGENISTNTNIEYSQPDGSILGYSFGAFSPAYRDFIQNDNTTSRVSLSFQQNVGLAGLETASELQITSTPKVLFHIKIRYVNAAEDAGICFYSDGIFQDQFFTACGGTATADCTNTPGVQITNDSYDCSEAGVATLGITNLETSEIGLYPNPVSTSFRIRGLHTMSQIRVYDVNGRLIVKDERSDEKPIDMSDYDNGVYLVEISNAQGTLIKRLIKK